jgi:TolB-like protein
MRDWKIRRVEGWAWVIPLLITVRLSAQCPDGSPPPCARMAATSSPTSVAVLYFDNLSRDTADVYLADGLSEEMIARLGLIDRLTVKSRTAVQRFRGRPVADPAMLGRALGVAHLVSGSVRRAGNRLRVTVELVRAATGTHLWGDVYDRPDTDLLAVEEDIARAVATAIAGRLLPAERASLHGRLTSNPRAYDLYLQGNHDLALRTAPAAARAIREYEAAARLDSTFARALARAAFGYALFPAFPWPYPGLLVDSLLARSTAAADRALRVDSTCSDAWMARAFLLGHLRLRDGFGAVRTAFERAVVLDPKNDEAWQLYGIVARAFGEDSLARVAMQHALALEPQRPITLARLAELEWMQGRFDDARRLLDSAIAVDPEFYLAYWDRALVRLSTGEQAAARMDAETAVRLSARDPLAELGLALVEATLGDTSPAQARLDRFWRAGRDTLNPNYWDASYAAQVNVALGEPDRALALLEHVRDPGLTFWDMLRFPTFDAVRSSPRFQRLFIATRPGGAR